MEKLKVFLSSTMTELHNERVAVQQALAERDIEVIWFEGFGARPETAQIAYLEGVQEADVYIGIFWNQYSPATEEEYREADRLGWPCFIYVKDFAVDRELKLQALINELERKHVCKTFSDALTLAERVQVDVQDWIVHQWRLGRKAKEVKFPQPSIILDSENGDFYLVKEGRVQYIPDNPTLRAIEKSLGLRIIKLSGEEMRRIPFSRGVPLRSQAPQIFQDSQGMKYLVAREEKRRIPNDETLKALGGDPRSSVPTEDEYLASLQEDSPLPEECGDQWLTSKPRLVHSAAVYISVFLVQGRIYRWVRKPPYIEELQERLGIGPSQPVDGQELESYVEGIPIVSEGDIPTALEGP